MKWYVEKKYEKKFEDVTKFLIDFEGPISNFEEVQNLVISEMTNVVVQNDSTEKIAMKHRHRFEIWDRIDGFPSDDTGKTEFYEALILKLLEH